MTNCIEINQHIRLFKQEFLLQQADYEKILKSQATKLREDGELFFSQYSGFDEKRGFIILKFSLNKPFPRKGEQLLAFIPSIADSKPTDWVNKTYEQIIQKRQRSTTLTPIWFQIVEEERILIGFSGCNEEFLNELPKNIPVCLGPSEPPIKYLLNLIYLLENREIYPRFNEVISLDLETDNWKPEALLNDKNTALLLSADFQLTKDIIIQGPPGTGKSFLIAQLCDLFLKQGKKVLIAALTNKALTEIAEKDGLFTHNESGKIYKSGLSLDEQKKFKNLRNSADYKFENGTLLLSSYYNLSELAKNASGAMFDVVIIEEASQAFLSTIGAGRHLGRKLLIVGDQKQMQPIRMISDQDLEHPNLKMAFEGLNSFGNSAKNAYKYLLNESFRLKPFSINLTNVFYEDKLISNHQINISGEFPLNFKNSKSVVKKELAMAKGLKAPSTGINCIFEDFLIFFTQNPKAEFAILSFYKSTVKEINSKIVKEIGFKENVIVDTIDRVQGLTVDFCFFLIPNSGLNFSLNPNRFNVATSRAKELTIIYLPDDLNLDNYDLQVKEYFERLHLRKNL